MGKAGLCFKGEEGIRIEIILTHIIGRLPWAAFFYEMDRKVKKYT
jgi:hypothetical protein